MYSCIFIYIWNMIYLFKSFIYIASFIVDFILSQVFWVWVDYLDLKFSILNWVWVSRVVLKILSEFSIFVLSEYLWLNLRILELSWVFLSLIELKRDQYVFPIISFTLYLLWRIVLIWSYIPYTYSILARMVSYRYKSWGFSIRSLGEPSYILKDTFSL